MLKRVFLGYSAPILPLIVDHILLDIPSLPSSLIIVPTAQSGRLLRESLAAGSTALLAPQVSTPGALLNVNHPSSAPRWLEKIAWSTALEGLSPSSWQQYQGLLPTPPDPLKVTPDWSLGIAEDLVTLSATLSEHNQDFSNAAHLLRNTPDANRWSALAAIYEIFEKILSDWNFIPAAKARENFHRLPDCERIIIAGVTEIPPFLIKALESFPGEVTVLIGAPESESDHFTLWGIPIDSWQTRILPPATQTHLAANPEQQAKLALDLATKSGKISSQYAIGSPDDSVGSALASTFSAVGWTAYHPAATTSSPSLVRWFSAWRNWLDNPAVAHLATLLQLPEIDQLAKNQRAKLLVALNKMRDRHPSADLPFISKRSSNNHPRLTAFIDDLLKTRQHFLSIPFVEALRLHLAALQLDDDDVDRQLDATYAYIEILTTIIPKIHRTHSFWLGILRSEISKKTPEPPENRVIDIQGWLELLYEPGPHLIIAGMNEKSVPSRPGGEPWLSENIREILGLLTTSQRHSRDTYLLHAMLESRKSTGSTHLICGKNSNKGDALEPSRLLLNVSDAELVPTVQNLFQEIEPPESNLIWAQNWKWQVPWETMNSALSATALATYLACPFRYYLQHVLRMDTPEPDRTEMNPSDFGTLTHKILQHWAQQKSASTETNAAEISAALQTSFAAVIDSVFHGKLRLPIRIQLESLSQRLKWFAELQAGIAAEGWEIIETEAKFEIPFHDLTIKGSIDRIDRHRDSGQLRVIDYKTGKKKAVDTAHLKKIIKSTKLADHLHDVSEVQTLIPDKKGIMQPYLWTNLQLPLYVEASKQAGLDLPIPTYISLGKTFEEVALSPWDTYSEDIHNSALLCSSWITHQIQNQTFWPPSEQFKYDPYEILAAKQHLSSQCELPANLPA